MMLLGGLIGFACGCLTGWILAIWYVEGKK